jgi:hypothetical protein
MPKKAAKEATSTAPDQAASAPARKTVKRTRIGFELTQDDIALRAYFIAQKRLHDGTPGDERDDWAEAERQLRSEIQTPRSKKKKAQ